MDVMDEKISPMLKYPKIKGSEERNLSEPPSLTLKLPCWKDVWQTSVFDEDYNPLYVKGKSEPGVTPLDYLVNTSKAPIQVIGLIQCGGLWFVGSPAKVSITWNLKQVIVRKPKVSSISDDTCFLTIRPNDMEALMKAPQPELEQNDHSVSALVDDSDNEDEYKLPPPVEKNIEPVVEVAATESTTESTEEPVKKKKVVSKKKVDA
jgi:hypothetical protein